MGFPEEASFVLGPSGRVNLPKPLRGGERSASQAEAQLG